MTAASLKDLWERKRRAMERRPSFARTVAAARVHLTGDLCCDVEEGGWVTRVDQSPEEGGTGSAPHPGQVIRAGLTACLAISYRNWGARLDVPVDDVEVEVMCESDARGHMGIEGVPVGWQRIVVDVRIVSPAPEAEVRRLVETADRLSPMLAILSPAIERVHRLRVVGSPANAPGKET